MAAAIPDPLLEQFSTFLAARLGLHFPPSRWVDLQRGLERAAREFRQPGPEACMRWLMAEPLQRQQVEILASHLTVGETYFYREPAAFAALEREVLPPLIAARRASGRDLRLWSAGCCTGEEAYSLAILLSRLLPDLDQWTITLLATDINPHFLARATRGEYREWSFRKAPPWFKAGYFTLTPSGEFAIRPGLRRLVSFDYLNLVDDPYPSLANNTNGMDIVLCRNVLMYFEESAICRVIDKLRGCLNVGGWLVVGQSEAGATMFSGLTGVEFDAALLYRKDGTSAGRTESAWPPDEIAAPPMPPSAAVPPPPPAARAAPAAVRPPPPSAYDHAAACYARGAYAEAADLLAALPDSEPRHRALAARAYANLGRLDEARQWSEAAVAADKCNPGLRYLLAAVLAEQGHSQAAAGALKQALYLDQDFVIAHFALANLYRRLGQAAPAARHFGTARHLLDGLPPGSPLPEAEGLTAERLRALIDSAEQLA